MKEPHVVELSDHGLLGESFKGMHVDWCHLCDTAVLICPECKNSTCNGGGCAHCKEAFDTFQRDFITHATSYLSHDEVRVYEKGRRLKRFIEESIRRGEFNLNFKKLKEEGRLSESDEILFASELK